MTEKNEPIDFIDLKVVLKQHFGLDLADLTWDQMVECINRLPKPEIGSTDHRSYVEAMRKQHDGQ